MLTTPLRPPRRLGTIILVGASAVLALIFILAAPAAACQSPVELKPGHTIAYQCPGTSGLGGTSRAMLTPQILTVARKESLPALALKPAGREAVTAKPRQRSIKIESARVRDAKAASGKVRGAKRIHGKPAIRKNPGVVHLTKPSAGRRILQSIGL